MKTLIAFLALSVCASAAEWNGTLVDVMCKGQDLASHTRKCALDCAKSGYGIVTADGNFYKLDEAGNARALETLQQSKKDKDLKAKITGSLNGGVIHVETIELAQ